MPDEFSQFATPEIAHDVVQLPSKGLYYPNKKAQVKVAYLNASDENILTSISLIESGEMLDVLLERKVLDKDLRPSDMLDGDRVAILFWLRATGYGAIFPMQFNDPISKKTFDHEIDLTKIPYKEDLLTPNEAGECDFMFPDCKKNVKFKFLSGGAIKQLSKDDDNRMSKMGRNAFSSMLTSKLIAQIQSIDGIDNKGEIAMFVEKLKVIDSAALRKYINVHEAGLDLAIEVTAPSGARFPASIGITAEFFWPYL